MFMLCIAFTSQIFDCSGFELLLKTVRVGISVAVTAANFADIVQPGDRFVLIDRVDALLVEILTRRETFKNVSLADCAFFVDARQASAANQ